jgi:hypothetical protein
MEVFNPRQVAEVQGDLGKYISAFEVQHQFALSYISASPPPNADFFLFTMQRVNFVGNETAHFDQLHPFRRHVRRFLKAAGCTKAQDCEAYYSSSPEWAYTRKGAQSASDGLRHRYPKHAMLASLCGLCHLAFAEKSSEMLAKQDAGGADTAWLDELPPAHTPTLHCTFTSIYNFTTARVLVAEVRFFER